MASCFFIYECAYVFFSYTFSSSQLPVKLGVVGKTDRSISDPSLRVHVGAVGRR